MVKCSHCNRKFQNENAARMHFLRVHGNMGPGHDGFKPRRTVVRSKRNKIEAPAESIQVKFCPGCGFRLHGLQRVEETEN